MIYIFWTARDSEEARRIIFDLLEKRLIACASIVPEVKSIYRWQGKIHEDTEVKVIFKTVGKHFDTICQYIVEKGSYQVPEIAAIPARKIRTA